MASHNDRATTFSAKSSLVHLRLTDDRRLLARTAGHDIRNSSSTDKTTPRHTGYDGFHSPLPDSHLPSGCNSPMENYTYRSPVSLHSDAVGQAFTAHFIPKPEFVSSYVGLQDRTQNDTRDINKPPMEKEGPQSPSSQQVDSSILLLSCDNNRMSEPIERPNIHQITENVLDFLFRTQFGNELEDLSDPFVVWDRVKQCVEDVSQELDNDEQSPHGGSFQIPSFQTAGSGNVSNFGSWDGRSLSNNQQKQDSGKRRSGAGRKNNGTDNGDSEGDDTGEAGDQGGLQDQRLGLDLNARLRLSCPFRKRNKGRFNIRAHPKCAEVSHPHISAVK